jgi:isopenicillin N synthase-like dioxygenase
MRDVGFAYIVNHGIPAPKIDLTFNIAKGLFALGDEEKGRFKMGANYIGVEFEVPGRVSGYDF